MGRAEQQGIIITTYPSNGNACQRAVAGMHGPIDFGAAADRRQEPRLDAEKGAQLGIPLQCPQIHEHRPAGIGNVGDMHPAGGAAGQVLERRGRRESTSSLALT